MGMKGESYITHFQSRLQYRGYENVDRYAGLFAFVLLSLLL